MEQLREASGVSANAPSHQTGGGSFRRPRSRPRPRPRESLTDGWRDQQAVIKPSVTPDWPPTIPTGATSLRKECRGAFRRLLASISPHVKAIPAGYLCELLQNLGLSSHVDEDFFCHILLTSGYTDEFGTLNEEQFRVFATDFRLLESIRAHIASSVGDELQSRLKKRFFGILEFMEGEFDRGPLGSFFQTLQAGKSQGFVKQHFIAAFDILGVEIGDADADSLVKYAELDSGVRLSFPHFLKVLGRTDQGQTEEGLKTTGISSTFCANRKTSLNNNNSLERLMTFVSSYVKAAITP